jgi:plasmid stabilization system protein ParE
VSLQVTYYEAAQYYEAESRGLGAGFVTEVERCTAAIVEHPELGTLVRGRVRRRLVHRFPYGLLYSQAPNAIRILAVMNLKRRPTYWLGRT